MPTRILIVDVTELCCLLEEFLNAEAYLKR